jgi:putative endopeptidase
MRRASTLLLSAMLFMTAGTVAADPLPSAFQGLGGENTAVRPGDDFNVFANGTYLDKLVIPADRSSYGVDDIMADATERWIKELLESDEVPVSDAAADIGQARALYRAFMDQDRVDAIGAKPLGPDLAAVKRARTRLELDALMGTGVKGFEASLFDVSIDTNSKSPGRYAVVVSQSDMGLGERDYYLKSQFAALRRNYRKYIARMLTFANWPDASAEAEKILSYETRIAITTRAPADRRDPDTVPNPTTPVGLATAAPGFKWMQFLNAAGLGAVHRLAVHDDMALLRLAKIYAQTPVKTLKAWAAFHLVDKAAPYLARPFADAHFAFHGVVLSDQPRQPPRWKRGVALVDGVMGDAIGHVYVDRTFPPQARAQIVTLAEELRAAFEARILRANWLSPETRQKAIGKLSQLTVMVGYPDKWHEYSTLDVRADDLYGDVARAAAFEWKLQLGHLNQPVDPAEWGMTPQTIDAYCDLETNAIVLPAAILQAPYFDMAYDAAINYGGIGAVIGHEMTHAFDDKGRDFDGSGTSVNWWTGQDEQNFSRQAAKLASQYDHYEPYPGVHVNGKLTSSENIADLGGVLIALDAYHRSLHGQPAPVIGGMTGDQRFFLAFARTLREKRREAEIRQLVVSDSHSPEQYRINGVLRNVDDWYDSFSVRPGDKLYLDPAARVHIW